MGTPRYGDETWQLALRSDSDALRRAADLLLHDSGIDSSYEAYRARAFALAVDGWTGEALDALNEGWTEEWPFPSAYLADVARVRFLAGDYASSLEALALSARGADTPDPAVRELVPACVREGTPLRRALSVALAAGTPWQRVATTAAVLRGRALRGRGRAAARPL